MPTIKRTSAVTDHSQQLELEVGEIGFEVFIFVPTVIRYEVRQANFQRDVNICVQSSADSLVRHGVSFKAYSKNRSLSFKMICHLLVVLWAFVNRMFMSGPSCIVLAQLSWKLMSRLTDQTEKLPCRHQDLFFYCARSSQWATY